MDDKLLLTLAYEYATKHSTDPSTQNGALIIEPSTKNVLCFGANHFPEGVIEKEERWERPEKYAWVEHAERNVIYSAAKQGIALDGKTMYCCWAACADCARAIIQSGIKEVVTHYDPANITRFGLPASQDWLKSIAKAITMFQEAGVQFRWVDGQLQNNYSILFNGKEVTP